MSRVLTPSKIGLLALIAIYAESVVPSMATIPTLSFLASHVLSVSLSTSQNEATSRLHHVTLAMDDFQKATIGYASGIPGRTIWDLLLKKLWNIDSLDALHVFFDNLSLILQKTQEEQQKDAADGLGPVSSANRILLSRISLLGTFIRRAQVEFTRLQFRDGAILWKSFVAYRAPTLSQWKKRNPTVRNTSFDVNLQADKLSLDDRLTEVVYGGLRFESQQASIISTDDVEKLLEFQVDNMQRTLEPQRRHCCPC